MNSSVSPPSPHALAVDILTHEDYQLSELSPFRNKKPAFGGF